MAPPKHEYYTYILTNPAKTVLYIGVTNNIRNRIEQHRTDAANERKTFAGKYNCIHLLYYETYGWIHDAIAREKELKGWIKSKKIALIQSVNPSLNFLEEQW